MAPHTSVSLKCPLLIPQFCIPDVSLLTSLLLFLLLFATFQDYYNSLVSAAMKRNDTDLQVYNRKHCILDKLYNNYHYILDKVYTKYHYILDKVNTM